MFCCMQNLQLDFRVYGTFQYRERAFSDVGEEGRRWRPIVIVQSLDLATQKYFRLRLKQQRINTRLQEVVTKLPF